MSNKASQHILSTSANLLGFGLFVITSLHIANKSEVTLIDDFATIVTILLAFSCLFSFFAIKSEKERRKRTLELIADYLFILALLGIIAVVLLLVFNLIK